MNSSEYRKKSLSEKWRNTVSSRDKTILLFCKVIILAISLSFMLTAIGEQRFSHETDSYMLPTISMEYRFSIVMTPEDIEQARIDYPFQYAYVEDYDSLRSAKLNQCAENQWLSYYFPVYPLICLPAKLILQLFDLDQSLAFPLTNAILLILTLIIVYRRLNTTPLGKLTAIVLLIASPINRYIPYISSEAMLFSFITIALVLYQNKKYKSAAFLIAVASMPNPTVMAIGIVMIIAHFVRLFISRNNVKLLSAANLWSTVKYGCCYIPCLIPFIFNYLMLGTGNPTSGGATLKDYGARVLSYLFDINFGFTSFAAVTMLMFFALVVISIVKKKYNALLYFGFFLCPIMAYSLMIFVNSIAIGCARYVMWTYPTLVIGVIELVKNIEIREWKKYTSASLAVGSTILLLTVNYLDYRGFHFNNTACFLLDNFPYLYSPYYGTFYNRNDGYNLSHFAETPSYYFSTNQNYLTKLLLKSTEEYKQQVLAELYGDEASEQYLNNVLDEIPNDDEFHYIDFPPQLGVKLEKLNIEQLGIVSENKVVYESNEPISIPEPNSNYPFAKIDFNSEPFTLYKIEIEFDHSAMPKGHDSVLLNLDKNARDITEFINERENHYTFFANSADSDESRLIIYIKNNPTVIIDSIKITAMNNDMQIFDSGKSFSVSGNMEEETVAFDIDFDSFKEYKVKVQIENPQDLSEEDKLYFMLDYESGYSPNNPKVDLRNAENSFIYYSYDFTLADTPPQIKVVGKTAKPIIISSIKIERAS